MLIAIIILALLIVIFFLLYMHTRMQASEDFSAQFSEEDLLSNITALADKLKKPNASCSGLHIMANKKKIERTYLSIKNKVKYDSDIFDCEKWLYENYFSIQKYLSGYNFKQLPLLPCKFKQPRIVILARFIVSACKFELDRTRIIKAIESFNAVTPLYNEEIKALPLAFAYVIGERLSKLATGIYTFNKMKDRAERDVEADKRFARDESYLYHYIKSGKNIKKSFIDKYSDIDINTLEMSYNAKLIEYNILTSHCIKALKILNETLDENFILSVSPINKIMSSDLTYRESDNCSKLLYMNAVERLSKQFRVGERAIIDGAFKVAIEQELYFGDVLFGMKFRLKDFLKGAKRKNYKDSTKFEQRLFIASVALIDLALSALCALLMPTIPLAITVFILSYIAIFKVAENIVIRLSSMFISKRPIVRMSYDKLPKEGKTLTVMSELISSATQAVDAIKRLNSIAQVNKDKNIQYCLLVDLPSCETPESEKDIEIIQAFKKSANDLKVLIRKRVKSGKVYCGYERKRGAINALNNYLLEGDSDAFREIIGKVNRPNFVVLLDSDTQLGIGAIKKCVNTMLSPTNEKYDILTFENAYKFKKDTYYADRFDGCLKNDSYCAENDYFFNLSAHAIFSGKGIYRLESFSRKLEGKIPEGRVLSHDILEGAILSCGNAGITAYEDIPSSLASDIQRKERWGRGDVQLLPFCNKKFCSQPLQKYVIFTNAFEPLAQMARLAIILISLAVLQPILLLPFLLSCALPTILGIFDSISSTAKGVRARYAVINSFRLFSNWLFDIILLPIYALRSVAIMLITLCKMTSKKTNLLVWNTFASGQNSSLKKHLSIIFPPIAVCVVVAAFLYNYIFVLFYFLIVAIVANFSYILSLKKVKNTILTQENSVLLGEIATKTYRYFEENDGEGLICDNLQISPYKGKSKNTSPTNIGFRLLADICGYYNENLSREECIKSLENQLNKIEKLEKWNGNLYNWYNAINCAVVAPRFVSSVDSGNFLASLIVLSSFLEEIEENQLKVRVDKLIAETKLMPLYNKDRELFYIGYNEDERRFCGNYDLLASEARILFFIASCLYDNSNIWTSPQRCYSGAKGNILMSWSGTAFEYFMPELFLAEADGSLLALTANKVAKIFMKNKCNKMFGISESGYFAFDEDANYQYKAFGLSKLALREHNDMCVISPYASMLTLKYNGDKVIDNYRQIEKLGGVGDYGCFEAIDCTRGTEIVKSYMSHHQGMTLCAITNALNNNVINRLFMSNPLVSGGNLLLQEKLSERKYPRKEKADFVYNTKEEIYSKYIQTPLDFPYCHTLSNGKYVTVLDDYGQGYSKHQGRYINRFSPDIYSTCGGFFYVKSGDKISSPTYAPMKDGKVENYSVFYEKACAEYKNAQGLNLKINVPTSFDGEVKKLEIDKNFFNEDIEVAYYEELSLASADEDYSHLNFNDMFISTEFISDYNAIVACRKSRSKHGDYYVAIAVSGVEKIIPCTNINAFLGRNGRVDKPKIFNSLSRDIPLLGDVLYPCLGFKAKAKAGGNVIVYKIVGDDYNSIMAKLKRLNSVKIDEYCFEESRQYAKANITLDGKSFELAHNLISQLIFRKKDTVKIIKENYEKHLDTFGLKGKTVYIDYDENKQDFKSVFNSVKYINSLQMDCGLLIAYSEKNENYSTVKSEIDKIVGKWTKNIIAVKKSDKNAQSLAKFKSLCFYIVGEENTQTSFNYGHLVSYAVGQYESKKPYHKVVLKSGAGGFDELGAYVVNKTPRLPYSNVICGKKGGFVITENGGGYMYYANSNTNRLTRWKPQAIIDAPTEEIYICEGGEAHRINTVNNGYVKHSNGESIFAGCINKLTYTIRNNLIFEGDGKLVEVVIKNDSDDNRTVDLLYRVFPDEKCFDDIYNQAINESCIRIVEGKHGKELYIKSLEKSLAILDRARINRRASGQKIVISNSESTFNNPANAMLSKLFLKSGEIRKIKYIITAKKEIAEGSGDYEKEKELQLAYFNNLNNFEIDSGDKSLDILFNNWLMYQVVSSRINGRCGYYQAGGAVGFRDQLQDCLAMMYLDEDFVKNHIIKCCERQFIEGDVLHWWHEKFYGVRTRITDDRLFLPYLVARYIQMYGDYSILDIKCKYVLGNPLPPLAEASLDERMQSDFSESVLLHCVRAIDSVLNYGEHGLLLIGGGDWNDALNEIGLEGKGESVFLTMMAVTTIENFIKFIDVNSRMKYLDICKNLRIALESAYRNGYFRRAFTDKGEWLGDAESKNCKIDILSQAFAVFADIGDRKMQESAINRAIEIVDKDYQIIPLLTPPFDKTNYCGYISSYPKGVRENGGQYTHASVWLARACCLLGKDDYANALLDYLNPIKRCSDEALNRDYCGEPYVMPADIYTNKDNYGRMGWSWYTGSASWLYVTILENYLGISIENNTLKFKKPIIRNWQNLKVKYRKNKSVYNISFGVGKGIAINGVNNSVYSFKIGENDGEIDLVVKFNDSN